LRTKVTQFGKVYAISAEIFDVATGGSAGAAEVEWDGEERGLPATFEALAAKLTGTEEVKGGSGETVTPANTVRRLSRARKAHGEDRRLPVASPVRRTSRAQSRNDG
jgi:hypothetical protein